MKKNEASKKSEGFNKYILGPEIILESKTWKEAIQKAARKKREYQFSNNNYPFTKTKMWKTYQFLFLCTFIEFRLAELICEITKENTPRILLIKNRMTLGNLIDFLDKNTIDFQNKEKFMKSLKIFNGKRIDFTHHSFSSSIDNSKILITGLPLGMKIVQLTCYIEKSLILEGF